ncbi:MAG: ATP-binding cassette domain-containing protein [Candidatus Electryoneaceae bacterium]|nr:ATP-binding cassette domain-containing protein [Candidatus Electryoneaceae bacterium]
MIIVEIANITKTFDRHVAVDDLSLSVPKGSIYGFIGPNGSGKTTTLRMIMNIFYPDSGSVRVFGEEVHGASSDRIGYLPEERGLYKNMKVCEVLRFYGSLKNGRNLAVEIDRWLEIFDLGKWANKKIGTLSKGMSQKVQFIATVVSKPDLLILDEPFTGLDPVNTDLIKTEILKLQDSGTTVIFSTHDMSIAEKMCDFIFMIFKGKKVLDGTLTSIQDQYAHDTMRVTCEGDMSFLQKFWKAWKNVNDSGHVQEIRLAQNCDHQDILSAIMAKTRINSFEIAKPSLHDIFVRIANPEEEGTDDE